VSSKILSAQDSTRWRRQSKASGRSLKVAPPSNEGPEFRGLPDKALITLVCSLCGFGLMAVFSASAPEALSSYQDATYYLRRQAICCVLGLFAMFTISRYDYRRLKKWAWPVALGAFGLLCLTLVPGISVTTMGSTRWLQIGPLQFQPSEMCKIASILLIASGISKHFWWHRQVLVRIALVLMMATIVVKQPDLGTAMMLSGGMVALLFAGGLNPLLIVLAGGGAFGYMWHHVQKTPYQMARIMSWLDPYKYPQKEGWNAIQAQLAIGSGGLFGVGFGRSMQKLFYLPVQHADFIFAVIAEEFGLIGCTVLISLFILFGYFGFRTALRARTLFGRFLAIGITSSITLQAMVNIMVTTGIVPVTGITLPFISYGGTSLVITLAMVGVLLSVSRDRGQMSEDDDDDDDDFKPAAQTARA